MTCYFSYTECDLVGSHELCFKFLLAYQAIAYARMHIEGKKKGGGGEEEEEEGPI